MTRVIHASSQFETGGAARAAKRLCDAQVNAGIEVVGLAATAASREAYQFPVHVVGRYQSRLASRVEEGILASFRLHDGNSRSLGLFPSRVPREAARIKPDVVNLHWLGRGFLAGWQVSSFKCPIVWTLHDLWAASGSLHYPTVDSPRFDARARQFFSPQFTRRSLWLERMLASLKSKKVSALTLIAPTEWLEREMRSRISADFLDIRRIPIPVPTGIFMPSPKSDARHEFGLDEDRKIVGFAAATRDSYAVKGAQLLPGITSEVRRQCPDVQTIAITSDATSHQEFGMADDRESLLRLAPIDDDVQLAKYYAALDVLVVPSLIDNFNQVAAEALSCGTPVVAFDNSGLSTVVQNGRTGLLSPAFDVDDLGAKVGWLLNHERELLEMSEAARERAVREWSFETVAGLYSDVYDDLLGAS